jgi:phosphate transport system substrate-binding protein
MKIRAVLIRGDDMKHFIAAIAIALTSTATYARDNVHVAGSSTVLPYASIVAELFGDNTDYPTPVIESGGSSAGLKRFCEGVGPNTVDIANASRKIREKEIKACADNGVVDITEIRIGYDGIVFASDINGPRFVFTPKDIYLALNADSTATYWDEVNPDLPHQKIHVFLPGTKHGTREVFEEKVLVVGCKDVKGHLDKDAEKACMKVRTDGVAVDIDGDYTETLASIEANPDSIGVFGLAFYENNTNKLSVALINGVYPSVETISSGEYPVSRPLYFYVKNAHLNTIPGLKEYVQFFVADELAGPDGPLAMYGLVPDPELADTQAIAAGW